MPELCADHEFDRKELRADHVIVLTALQQNACALPDASEEHYDIVEIIPGPRGWGGCEATPAPPPGSNPVGAPGLAGA